MTKRDGTTEPRATSDNALAPPSRQRQLDGRVSLLLLVWLSENFGGDIIFRSSLVDQLPMFPMEPMERNYKLDRVANVAKNTGARFASGQSGEILLKKKNETDRWNPFRFVNILIRRVKTGKNRRTIALGNIRAILTNGPRKSEREMSAESRRNKNFKASLYFPRSGTACNPERARNTNRDATPICASRRNYCRHATNGIRIKLACPVKRG